MPSEPKSKISDRLTSIILSTAVLVAVVASILVIWGGHSAMENLKLATGYATLIFLFFLSMIVLVDMIRNKINLSEMLEELSGGASMSRFQLLIFTFVIAFSLFVIVADSGKLPDIPTNVLALLGVSASTYAVSKGLQVSSDMESEPTSENNTAKHPAKSDGIASE